MEEARKRVLVVDDDESIRALLVRILSDYEVVAVASGEEALAEIRRQRPDLVVLDLRMPGMDGWEVVERLQQAGETVGIVILSGEEERPWPESPLVKARLVKWDVFAALPDTCERLFRRADRATEPDPAG